MDLIKEEKRTSWESDRNLAKKIAKEMNDTYWDVEKTREIMNKYLADKVMCLSFPPMPPRDGYQDKQVWINLTCQSRVLSADFQKENKRFKRGSMRSAGSAIITDVVEVFAMPDGSLYEFNAMGVYPVYNGKIIGYYLWHDGYPAYYNEQKEKMFNEILATLPYDVDSSEVLYLNEPTEK